VHPHLQVVGGDAPSGWLERVSPLAARFRESHGCSYWHALLETERALGERFVATSGPVGWLTAFSPDGSNEVLGLLPGRRHLLELDEQDVAALGDGLAAVLRGYGAMGLSTYNLAIHSGALDTTNDEIGCLVRVISRQNCYENYRADDYFLQKLLRTELVLTPPERLAERLRLTFDAPASDD
jgi:galactose-1-phosphate uridylyltransferase